MIAAFLSAVVSTVEAKVDVAAGTVAVSSWWWLPHFDNVMHVLLGVGGFLLLVFRCIAAYREARGRKKN